MPPYGQILGNASDYPDVYQFGYIPLGTGLNPTATSPFQGLANVQAGVNVALNPGSTSIDWSKGINKFNTSNNWNNNNNGLAGWANLIGAGSGILSGIAGIGGMINSFNAMDLARDQYNFQKRLANRNIANQAKIINNTYLTRLRNFIRVYSTK